LLKFYHSCYLCSFLTKEVEDFFDHTVKEQKRYRNETGVKRDDILEMIAKRAKEIKTSEGTKKSGKFCCVFRVEYKQKKILQCGHKVGIMHRLFYFFLSFFF